MSNTILLVTSKKSILVKGRIINKGKNLQHVNNTGGLVLQESACEVGTQGWLDGQTSQSTERGRHICNVGYC
jgi:hypothetical protein